MARPRQVSDEVVLGAARRCFLEQGPAVSTDVIAAELGVSSQALFKRFGSKQALMLAALRPPAVPPWAEELAQGPDERPLGDQLQEILETIAKYFSEMARRMTLIRWSGVPLDSLIREYDPPLPQISIAALRGWLERACERGLMRPMDVGATALALLGSVHAHVFLTELLQRPPTEHTREEYMSEVVDLFVRALAPAAAPMTLPLEERP